MSDSNNYKPMENILQAINRDFIRLPEEEIARNNVLMKEVISLIVGKMREICPLFNKLFGTYFYGGSYYDGLKVGHPDEYDIDLLLVLPKNLKPEVVRSTMPGYVHAILGNKEDLEFLCETGTNYLDTEKISRWIQGLIHRAINCFSHRQPDLWITSYREAGPAFTLEIRGTIDDMVIVMDIDLVTCFLFNSDSWPTGGYRPNPCPNENTFFIVPKSPKSVNYYSSRYWRLSFQAQERRLIHGKEKLKPALKLLKKMRNTLKQPVASYHLKTIVLWENEKHPQNFSANKTLSYLFMHILKLYKEHVKRGEILYFWNKKLNLLDGFQECTCENFGNRLEKIIKKIEDNPLIIASYILEPNEFKAFKESKVVPEAAILPEPEPQSSCIIL